MDGHAAVAGQLVGDEALVRNVLAYYRTAQIGEWLRAVIQLIDTVNAPPAAVSEHAVAQARDAGWPDEALYDAIAVCALFRFYNTWADAAGVSDLPQYVYELQAERLAAGGYAGAPDETVPHTG